MGLQRGRRALLTLEAAHVGELAAELAALLQGRALERVVAAPPRDALLVFPPREDDRPRHALRLRLSADPDQPRAYLQQARQAPPSGPPGPFYRTLEAELAGATLARLEQVGGDRILRLAFTGTHDGRPRFLFAELTGRHANLVLCGPGERVLAVLVPPPPAAKSAPRLREGEVWQPPPGKPRASDAPPLAQLLAAPPPGDDAAPHPRAPLSWRVERGLTPELEELGRARAAKDLAERLERKRQRARALVQGLERRATAAEDAERVRLDGELLKASLHAVRRGMERVELPDVTAEGAPPRAIALDPRRTPRENVEQLFERYRKLVRAQASVHQELALARERAAALDDLLARAAAPEADPAALEREAIDAGLLDARQEPDARKRKAPEPRKPYRTFAGLHGGEIRVGRSAKDNDELTLRHCRGNDLWLHTADAPGSHVVLRLERNAEPDPEDLLDAAHLAVHFSPLRDASRANVHVARRKLVHKPKGAKPGLVTLSGGKSLSVRMQPERVARLLGGDRHGPRGAAPEPA